MDPEDFKRLPTWHRLRRGHSPVAGDHTRPKSPAHSNVTAAKSLEFGRQSDHLQGGGGLKSDASDQAPDGGGPPPYTRTSELGTMQTGVLNAIGTRPGVSWVKRLSR